MLGKLYSPKKSPEKSLVDSEEKLNTSIQSNHSAESYSERGKDKSDSPLVAISGNSLSPAHLTLRLILIIIS